MKDGEIKEGYWDHGKLTKWLDEAEKLQVE
jgi:hypothetical protein